MQEHDCLRSARFSIKRQDEINNILWVCMDCHKIEFMSTATEIERFMYQSMSYERLWELHNRQNEERRERLDQNRRNNIYKGL